MATLRPFRGLRYTEEAGPAARLVAPPYDVISPAQREEYAAKNEHNVVRLTLPEQLEDDRSKFVKYARSAARLEEWRRDGKIARDDAPSFYRYTQRYRIPGTDKRIERTKIVTTIKVEPYSKGVVLPHEQTFPKHKEDRLRILEATRSHLECIFGLYEDDDRSTHSLVTQACATPLCAFVTEEDDIEHVFERISDKPTCDTIVSALADKKVWIADGHHRYETALTFREKMGEMPSLIAEDFMMMALCSISDPGLVLLPTHRILKNIPITTAELRERLVAHFRLSPCKNADLMGALSISKNCAFGFAAPGGEGFLAESENRGALAHMIDAPGGDDLKRLDVSILHGVVFSKVLGCTGHDFFDYTRSEAEAVASVEHGAPLAVLMNPPSVDDMRRIATAGDFMPQKSTYYYPKLLSGLVMWSLKDFEP